jgi:hypothetical protein
MSGMGKLMSLMCDVPGFISEKKKCLYPSHLARSMAEERWDPVSGSCGIQAKYFQQEVAAPRVQTVYSPAIHDTGSAKPKKSLRKSLARRHLTYSSLILA